MFNSGFLFVAEMKCLILLMICCGIALGYDATDDCSAASNRLNEVNEKTKSQITLSLLWLMRKTGRNLYSHSTTRPTNRKLEKYVTEKEIAIGYTAVVRHLLHTFDLYKNEIGPETLDDYFEMLESINSGVSETANLFFNQITEVRKKGSLKADDIEQIDDFAESMYVQFYNAIAVGQLIPSDLNANAIATIDKLHTNIDAVVDVLKKSTFGEGILSFVETCRSAVVQIRCLFALRTHNSTLSGSDSNNYRALALQMIIDKLHEIYALENMCNSIFYIVSVLEKLDAAAIKKLAPPTKSVQATCDLLQTSFTKLWKIICFVRQELQNANGPESIFLQRFFKKIFPMETNRLIVNKQLIELLRALKVAEHDASKFVESGEIVDEFVLNGLEKGPEYNIRYEYQQTIAAVDKQIFKNWTHATELTRGMWQHFIEKLLKYLKNKEKALNVQLVISNDVQGLQIWNMTNFLASLSAGINHPHLQLELEILNYFEKSLDDFIKLANGLTEANFDQEILGAHAKNIFSSIQLVLYQFAAVAPYETTLLSGAVEKMAELAVEFNESTQINELATHSAYKSAIQPMVKSFQAIAVQFIRLVDLDKELSTDLEKNRMKIAILNSVTYLADGAYNFVYVVKAFSYILYVLQLKNDNDVGQLYVEDILRTSKTLDYHMTDLTAVIKLIEKICGKNASIEGNIIGQLKKMSELLFICQNGTYRAIRNRIVHILLALPAAFRDDNVLYTAYMELNSIFMLPEIESSGANRMVDDDLSSGNASFYAAERRRVGPRVKNWTGKISEAEDEVDAVEIDAEEQVQGGRDGVVEGVEEGVEDGVEEGVVEEVDEMTSAWTAFRHFLTKICC